ncbi:hypothetical protein GCM10009415_29050 [Chitinophaga japonensis]
MQGIDIIIFHNYPLTCAGASNYPLAGVGGGGIKHKPGGFRSKLRGYEPKLVWVKHKPVYLLPKPGGFRY